MDGWVGGRSLLLGCDWFRVVFVVSMEKLDLLIMVDPVMSTLKIKKLLLSIRVFFIIIRHRMTRFRPATSTGWVEAPPPAAPMVSSRPSSWTEPTHTPPGR